MSLSLELFGLKRKDRKLYDFFEGISLQLEDV